MTAFPRSQTVAMIAAPRATSDTLHDRQIARARSASASAMKAMDLPSEARWSGSDPTKPHNIATRGSIGIAASSIRSTRSASRAISQRALVSPPQVGSRHADLYARLDEFLNERPHRRRSSLQKRTILGNAERMRIPTVGFAGSFRNNLILVP